MSQSLSREQRGARTGRASGHLLPFELLRLRDIFLADKKQQRSIASLFLRAA
jgi:hypothetical protein